MDIYDAAGKNGNGDGACPPMNLLNGYDFPKGLLLTLSQGLCGMHVASALLNTFSRMIFAMLTAVTCTDELNLGAICGSGIAGVFAGALGIAKAGTALWMACDVAQRPFLHDLSHLLRKIDDRSGNKITDLIRGSGALGRRLLDSDRVVELKAKYDSPADVWKELGMDIEDPKAAWRELHKEKQLRSKDMQNFVQADEETYAPLFGGAKTCSA